MNKLLITVILLIAAFQTGAISFGTTDNDLLLKDFVQVRDVHISGSRKRDVDFEIRINAYGEDHILEVVQNVDLFVDGAKVTIHGDDDVILESRSPINRAYKEKDDHGNFIRLTFMDEERSVLKGYWSTAGEVYYIDPSEEHYYRDNVKRDTTHVVYKASSVIDNPDLKCGNHSHTLHDIDLPSAKRSTQTVALAARSSSPPPSPCPSSVKRFIQSVAADHTYVSKAGGSSSAESTLIAHWNTISSLYIDTLNIKLQLDEIVLKSSSSSIAWNSQSCSTIENKLNDFSQWRGTRNTNAGLWHLVTNCYPPPGTIGLAWLGVTCMTNTVSQSSSKISGAGVSNYLTGANGYRVIAHETGHNFNAQHDQNDGIMQPSIKAIDYFSKNSQSQMCSHIQSKTSKCYKSDTCTPSCSGKSCGSDGCGGACGTCSGSTVCNNGQCETTSCTPRCSGRNCGSDGCGGSCGTCSNGQTCSSGTCKTNNQPDPTTESARSLLVIHNRLRSDAGVPPLTWSGTLENAAKQAASICRNSYTQYARNVATGRVGASLSSMISPWISQQRYWNCYSNRCYYQCGYYTQMIWENTQRVGCAVQECGSGRSSYQYLVCHYDPPGNLPGQRPVPQTTCMAARCDSGVTCGGQGKQCGAVATDCGSIECGNCGSGSECLNNTCSCVPYTSCGLEQKTCGTVFNGCEEEVCGSCGESQVCSEGFCVEKSSLCGNNFCSPNENCVDGSCVCVPTRNCSSSQVCGYIHNGCEEVLCGSCLDNQQCMQHQCTSCQNCDVNALCTEGHCECATGFSGDGVSCTRVPDSPSLNLEDWDVIVGEDESWIYHGENTIHHISENFGAILMEKTDLYGSDSTVNLSVTVTASAGSKWGFLWRYQSEDATLTLTLRDQKIVFGENFDGTKDVVLEEYYW
eukprot:TRINITY_DN3474_c0_g1_i1.p1 TRINITY_DN3474_c0_g1~~TRINITY_DN3474_c0_g1_i1.p1  ORF type:complete len:925 (-),score=184.87 TRINITY_DN3474_c0_g1_i1:1550-4282(-)